MCPFFDTLIFTFTWGIGIYCAILGLLALGIRIGQPLKESK